MRQFLIDAYHFAAGIGLGLYVFRTLDHILTSALTRSFPY